VVTGARDLLGEYHRADRRLIQTSEVFDFPLDPAPANVRHVGPILDDPYWVAGEMTQVVDQPPGKRPLVVAGFSSTYQKQEAVLLRTIEALGTLPVTAIVSTGPAVRLEDIDASGLPDNVTLSRAHSHAATFPRAAAVVTHAGHGTVMRALASGAPLVCLPMGRDQDDNAEKVAYHGAGLRLPKTASPQRIAAAVRRVMTEPEFREAARRLGELIRRDAAEQRAVTELEGLAVGRVGRPIADLINYGPRPAPES
jgi:UDP:flavonoid glycosyltransferase YjiC (YdhE family)